MVALEREVSGEDLVSKEVLDFSVFGLGRPVQGLRIAAILCTEACSSQL